jgi:hypothetical protein
MRMSERAERGNQPLHNELIDVEKGYGADGN